MEHCAGSLASYCSKMIEFPAHCLSRLTLGTVQLGLPYGKLRPSLPPDDSEAGALLDAAWAGGIACFDTARAYGEAERRLGVWLTAHGGSGDGRSGPLVVSKLPVLDEISGQDPAAAVERAFHESAARLGQSRLAGYLVHRASDLHLPGVADALRGLAEAGRIGAFGASVYTVEDAERALAVPGLGLLQGPVSALDQRLVAAGIVERCAARGVVFFARSAFLQGLVFADPAALPPRFAAAKQPLERLRGLARDAGVPLAALALAAARPRSGHGSVVVGIAGRAELADVLAATGLEISADAVSAACELGRSLGPEILDPRRWS